MSENIFKEIYTKVLSLFKQTEQVDENAKEVAKNRLRVVLMQDRTNLTPELLQRMRKELIELLSKYVEMDKEALELNFDQEGDQMALMLSIPVIRAKDEEEIEKALAEESSNEEEVLADDDDDNAVDDTTSEDEVEPEDINTEDNTEDEDTDEISATNTKNEEETTEKQTKVEETSEDNSEDIKKSSKEGK